MTIYYCDTYNIERTNDDETSPTDDFSDEVDLELGVCPHIHTQTYMYVYTKNILGKDILFYCHTIPSLQSPLL